MAEAIKIESTLDARCEALVESVVAGLKRLDQIDPTVRMLPELRFEWNEEAQLFAVWSTGPDGDIIGTGTTLRAALLAADVQVTRWMADAGEDCGDEG